MSTKIVFREVWKQTDCCKKLKSAALHKKFHKYNCYVSVNQCNRDLFKQLQRFLNLSLNKNLSLIDSAFWYVKMIQRIKANVKNLEIYLTKVAHNQINSLNFKLKSFKHFNLLRNVKVNLIYLYSTWNK